MTSPQPGSSPTPHDHRTPVPGCFRCELNEDEMTTNDVRGVVLAGVFASGWTAMWGGPTWAVALAGLLYPPILLRPAGGAS